MSKIVLGFLAAALAGCAASPPPRIVRLDELAKLDEIRPGQQVVVELQPGDKIPVSFEVGGWVKTPSDLEPIELTVTKHVFVRIDEDGLQTSDDGKTFGHHRRPGSFQIGFRLKKTGASAKVAVRTSE